jgi:hypothetical protein
MRSSLKDVAGASLKRYHQHGKAKWLTMDPAQTTLLINMLNWTTDVEKAFNESAKDKHAMDKAHKH